MSRRLHAAFAALVAALLSIVTPVPPRFAPRADAQVRLDLPDASPDAWAGYTLGLTRIEVRYGSPAVKGRAIWGGLVPYDQVWRAGANMNTTISFSTPVAVEGTPLAAGTYGVHMIPAASSWTVIFSRQSRAWGSFSYDSAEDAARVTVAPGPHPMQERLAYTFDDATDDAVTVALTWEKLRVPFTVKVDLVGTVTADLEDQLRGLPRFSWQGWQQGANWLYTNRGDMALAMDWVDRSIAMARNYSNLSLKANLVEAGGDAKAAAALRAEAMTVATEGELNARGYQLLGEGKKDEALEVFRQVVRKHPDSWNAHDSLAEGLAGAGRTREALAEYRKALSLATDAAQKTRIEAEIKRLAAM